MFEFNQFLEKIDLEPKQVKLLRHDRRGVEAWRRGGANAFGCFVSFQKQNPPPYGGAEFACHFLPGPNLPDGSLSALFIGTTRILDQWPWDRERLPRIADEDIIASEMERQNIDAFDLEWLGAGSAFSERILINWGAGARAWFQWAHRQPKAIVELRIQAQEPPFPGFANFISRISEIPSFPQAWVGALTGVKGVYLLTTDQGEQYVGSATGAEGFMGRWQEYLANGHGGNVLLRETGARDYMMTILEIASPDMSQIDILLREAHWKAKLGSRAHGLNGN